MGIDPSLLAMLMSGGAGGPSAPMGPQPPSSPMMGVGPQGLPFDPQNIPPDVLLMLLQSMANVPGGTGIGPPSGMQAGMQAGMPPQPMPPGMPSGMPPGVPPGLMQGGPPMPPPGPPLGPPSGPPPGMSSGGPPSPPSGPPPMPSPPQNQGPSPAQAIAERKSQDYESMLPMMAENQQRLLQALFSAARNGYQGANSAIKNIDSSQMDSWLRTLQQLIGSRLGGSQGGPPQGPGPTGGPPPPGNMPPNGGAGRG